MKTEAEIIELLLASAERGRERGDTTSLEQALADSLRLERDRANRATAEAVGAESVYLLSVHHLQEQLEAEQSDNADLRASLEGASAAMKLAIHKIEQTIAGQYPEGQALQAALQALREVDGHA